MGDASSPDATEPLPEKKGAAPRLKLVVVSGPDFGKELLLLQGCYRVGKDPRVELPLTDRSVSRVHLTVEVLPHGSRVTDAGSKNGSFCEGMRFSSVDAQPNAAFTIGRTGLKLLPVTQPGPALAPSEKSRFGELCGKSLPMRSLFALLERVSAAEVDLLVLGETGTGKELCARAIHAASARSTGPLWVCDLAGIAPTLFESELFGHVKGAFTGALKDRPGALESAHRGTLFLDEVGELPLELQPRLLRFLERREVKRVGGNGYRKVDVRVVAATHRDLEAEVRAGRFREDLFHRLSVVSVRLPPLRERADDIPELVDDLLLRLGKHPSELSAETRALLAAHAWPGNVRELRNVVERAAHTGEALANGKAAPAGAGALPFKQAKERLVKAFERDYLASLLDRSRGNVAQAARDAGLDRVHLYRLLKKHGLG